MTEKDEQKTFKKIAKAEAKAAKKAPDTIIQPDASAPGSDQPTPAERSAAAAEKQLALHRWKVIFAGVSALIALVTLVVLLLR